MPVRIEIGKREIENKQVTIVRRDTNEKFQVSCDDLQNQISKLLEAMQNNLYKEQENFLKENTRIANTYEEFKQIMDQHKGFIKAFWCEDSSCEAKIKEETKATTRCLPLEAKEETNTCFHCGKSAKHQWLFGQAY